MESFERGGRTRENNKRSETLDPNGKILTPSPHPPIKGSNSAFPAPTSY